MPGRPVGGGYESQTFDRLDSFLSSKKNVNWSHSTGFGGTPSRKQPVQPSRTLSLPASLITLSFQFSGGGKAYPSAPIAQCHDSGGMRRTHLRHHDNNLRLLGARQGFARSEGYSRPCRQSQNSIAGVYPLNRSCLRPGAANAQRR